MMKPSVRVNTVMPPGLNPQTQSPLLNSSIVLPPTSDSREKSKTPLAKEQGMKVPEDCALRFRTRTPHCPSPKKTQRLSFLGQSSLTGWTLKLTGTDLFGLRPSRSPSLIELEHYFSSSDCTGCWGTVQHSISLGSQETMQHLSSLGQHSNFHVGEENLIF